LPTSLAKYKFAICKLFRKLKGCLHKIIGQDFCKKVRDAVDKEEEVLLEQVGSVVEDSASNLAIVESEGERTTREMENINRGPTFGGFVTIRTEGSMQDVTVAKLQSTRVQTPPLALF
jgi:hypothetical protein